MRASSFPRLLVFSGLVIGSGLTGCQTTSTTGQAKTNQEDMVYIPPSTGNMTGRWVPRSDAGAPSISPVSTASGTSVKKLQIEGLKNSPSSASVSQSGGGR